MESTILKKTFLSKPNLYKLNSLYREVLKVHKKVLPFTTKDMCDQAAMFNFRNARTHFSNTQFLEFQERWTAYYQCLSSKASQNVPRPKIMSGGTSNFDREIYILLS